LLDSNISPICPHNMVNFGPLAAEIGSVVWVIQANFNRFRILASLLHGIRPVGASQTAALNRGRHLYLAGLPSRWAVAHISSYGSMAARQHFSNTKYLPPSTHQFNDGYSAQPAQPVLSSDRCKAIDAHSDANCHKKPQAEYSLTANTHNFLQYFNTIFTRPVRQGSL